MEEDKSVPMWKRDNVNAPFRRFTKSTMVLK